MFWQILLVLLCVVVLVLLCPISILLRYDGKMKLKLGVWFFRFRLYPDREEDLFSDELTLKQKRKLKQKLLKKEARAERRRKKDRKKGKKATTPSLSESLKKRKSKGILKDLGGLFRMIRILSVKFGKRLQIKIKRLEIVAASDDAANTAYLFGALSQSVAYGLALADRYANLTFVNRRVSVKADFCAECTRVNAEVLFCMRVGSLLGVLCSALWLYAKESMKDSLGDFTNTPDNIQNKKGISL